MLLLPSLSKQMPGEISNPSYDATAAHQAVEQTEPTKPKHVPYPTKSPEAPRRGELARVAVDDPLMNLQIGNRRYRTNDGGTSIPVADAQKLIDAGVPGIKILPVSASGFGPGEHVNGRPRHEYFPGDCSCIECKETL